MGGRVQVSQHNLAHEAGEVELDETFLDPGLYDLLGTAQRQHRGLVNLPPLLLALLPRNCCLTHVSLNRLHEDSSTTRRSRKRAEDDLRQSSTRLLLELLTERHQQVLGADPDAVGKRVLILVFHKTVGVFAPLGALFLSYLHRA